MNSEEYKQKMLDLLKDDQTYHPITRDPTSRFQKLNNNLVQRLHTLKLIDLRTTYKLKTNSALCPRIYGQPKAHKQGLPLRPVVPNITAPSYNLSKYIGQMIRKSINSQYNVKDSFEFCEFINTVTLPPGHVLISLDVVSLFTCVPKLLVVHDVIYGWEEIKKHANNINLDLFLEMIEFCIDASYFKFNEQHYQQIFGTAMGNPLSSTVADLVMENLLVSVVHKLDFQLPFLKKYVDDIVTAIPPDKLDHVMEVFNSYNEHLQFTYELENNYRLPYLDMLLVRTETQTIRTEWYQKPIASGRFLDFHSFHPLNQKLNTATNLINRINTFSTNLSDQQKVKIMDNQLKINNYPRALRNRLINHRNTRRINPPVDPVQNDQTTPTQHLQHTYRSIAYIPTLTEQVKKQLKKDYPHIKLATRNIKTTKTMFTQMKDTTHKEDHKNVIYSIPCTDCNQQYIGMTTNKLRTRISGHKSTLNTLERLRQTGIPQDDPQLTTLSERTALLNHCIQLNHTFSFENTKILDRHNIESALPILEMLHISITPNTVNKRTDTEQLNPIYAGIINNLKCHNKHRHDNNVTVDCNPTEN
ncbi:uncharacterized protein LOC120412472 [Culex pipiens pallens]|uniref:uncharacterized protein LOC120412472 n=1 Tax=Culex pipiens pallens TaxID=42434 RepID=UPI0022AA9D78|nr:uncharacterized protein LOC120412472 [Culex pipiens pallens]